MFQSSIKARWSAEIRLPFFEEIPYGEQSYVGPWEGDRFRDFSNYRQPPEISKHTGSQPFYHPDHIFQLHIRKEAF